MGNGTGISRMAHSEASAIDYTRKKNRNLFPLRFVRFGVASKGRVAQIGLTGKKKVPKLGEMC